MGRKCQSCERLLGIIESLTAAMAAKTPIVGHASVKPAPKPAEEVALASHRQQYVDRAVFDIQKELGCTATEARAEAERLADALYAELQ